jgi:probable F420-dependent oxidoreductase
MHIGAVMFFTTYSMQPADVARELEQRGFESLWVPEHTHIPSSRKTPYRVGGPLIRPYYDIYDPFLALNTAAAVTTKLKIGTGIALVAQRDPIITAKEVSTIDQLSQGRFLFGVGNGWNQDEIENHGTNFKTRHKLARERIEAMKAIWTTEISEYHGELVKFDTMEQFPKPFQKPWPPIIIGGAYPYAAKRAIAYGNGWIPRADRLEEGEDGIGTFIKLFHRDCAEAGRDPKELPITVFRTADNIEQLRYCREVGVDRIVFTLPAEGRDKLLPIMDRWQGLMRELNEG